MTAREALEQVYGVYAIEQLVEERRAEKTKKGDKEDYETPSYERRDLSKPEKRQITRTDAEAKKKADTPHLTNGAWPEWDELELSETDPNKPPLKIQW